MATATKSTLNSKLPVVSKIAFCKSAGKSMATKIYTGENGKFSMLVGFKQNDKTYPFQIQYQQRSRYTNANAKVKGANWTAWSAWKNAVAVSGIAIDATESTKPVNTWMKANKGVNKNGTYQTFYNFSAYMIPATYDARQFKFRIRTFNKSKAKHGNWTTETLSVYKRAAVEDETAITRTDGGLKIKFNYIWDRNATIYVNSIKDSQGRELLKKAYTSAIGRVILSDTSYPQAREGYLGGILNIEMDKLKRKITVGETLTYDIKLTTEDGATTKFSIGAVIEPTRDIAVSVNYNWGEAQGLLTVTAELEDAISLASIGCNVSYTFNGKNYSIAPFKSAINLTGTSTFYFYPPISIPLTVHIAEEDAEDNKDKETISNLVVNGSGYRLNNITNTSINAVCWGQVKFNYSSQPQYETALPYGREKNVIFYGKGNSTTLSLTATIIDKAECYGGSLGMKRAWDNIRNNQTIYWFRTNKGEMYKVGINNIAINHLKNDLYEVQVSMMEVV